MVKLLFAKFVIRFAEFRWTPTTENPRYFPLVSRAMRYRFHPEALEEYQEAVNWYAQRGNPAALRFVEAVEDAIRRVVEAPERWRVN